VLFRVGLGIHSVGGENSNKGCIMEFISALALVVSVVKVTLMWLNYRDCKKTRDSKAKRNTD